MAGNLEIEYLSWRSHVLPVHVTAAGSTEAKTNSTGVRGGLLNEIHTQMSESVQVSLFSRH